MLPLNLIVAGCHDLIFSSHRLTSPLLLIAVTASLSACYVLSKRNNERKLVIAGTEVSMAQQYALVSVCSFPLFYLAGAGAAVFWVLGNLT